MAEIWRKKKNKKRYYSDNFPDQNFEKMYLNAIVFKDREKLMAEYKNLTEHVLEKMGGFDINNWKITNV